MHEAGEPNAVVDFFDAEFLTGEYGGDVDSLAMQAEPSACGDEKIKIVQRIGEFGQAGIASR